MLYETFQVVARFHAAFHVISGQCAYWSYYNPNKFGLLQVLPYFIDLSFYLLPIQFGFKPLTNGIFLLVNFSSFRFLQKEDF